MPADDKQYRSKIDEQYSRRQAIGVGTTKFVEIGAAVVLGGLAVHNSTSSHSFFAANIDDILQGESHEALGEFLKASKVFENALEALTEVYKQEYEKSHLVPHTYLDGDGNLQTELREETYWATPGDLPNNKEVDVMQRHMEGYRKTFEALVNGSKVDLSRLDELEIEHDKAGMLGQILLGGVVMYGGQIALLLRYEEGIASLRKDKKYGETATEYIKRKQSPGQISRRNFFKAVAAGVAAWKTHDVISANEEVAMESKGDLEKEIDGVRQRERVSGLELYKDHFTHEPGHVAQVVDGIIVNAQNALSTGIENENVRAAFERVVRQGKEYKSIAEDYLQDLPTELTDALEANVVTKRLRDINAGHKGGATGNLAEEAATSLGWMAAVLVPFTLLNRWYESRMKKAA